MKIDILCTDGSPLGVTMKSLWGEDGRQGVGGAEYSLLTIADEWTKRGHTVVLYNNPSIKGASPFEQRRIINFDPHASRDVLIIFRSPNPVVNSAVGRKIWWSQDQHTIGDFAEFSQRVDQIVCISEFHADYFRNQYGIKEVTVIDDLTRVQDYGEPVERIPHRFIFTSVPDRGLETLVKLWPHIKRDFPDASLVITSDYRLWGTIYPLNEKYRTQTMGLQDVRFKGAIKRKQFIIEQLSADVLAYPCIYDELFCIAVSEACVAGAYPITSTTGALRTTNMGKQIKGNPLHKEWQEEFLSSIYGFLNSPDKEAIRKQVIQASKSRFCEENILKQWNDKVFSHG